MSDEILFEQWQRSVRTNLDNLQKVLQRAVSLRSDVLSINPNAADAQTQFQDILTEKSQIGTLFAQYEQERADLAVQARQFSDSQTLSLLNEMVATKTVAGRVSVQLNTAVGDKRAELNATANANRPPEVAEEPTESATGVAQPDLGLPSTGSPLDKNGLGLSITDASATRLKLTNRLKPGGVSANQKKDPNIQYRTDRTGIVAHDTDWRVRISLAKSANIFYQQAGTDATIMAPLVHSGVVFPYTPQITVTHLAQYSSQNLTHANYQSYFYQNSEVQDITISGDFTAQNHDEARYVLAVIYFFRAATKMFYGSDKAKSGLVGMPPPIVFLNGYGKYYFPNVPCVITNFTHVLPDGVDYMPVIATSQSAADISTANERRMEETRIPTASQMTVTLRPMYSRKNVYDNFSLDDFAQGKLLGNKIRGSGGFI